jgi:hypothetical protein
MCPEISLQVLGLELRLGVQVGITIGGQRVLLLSLPACPSGPPTPF